MQIMAEHDIDIPVSKMAETPEEAEKACADIMGGDGKPPDVRKAVGSVCLTRAASISSQGTSLEELCTISQSTWGARQKSRNDTTAP